MGTSVAVPVAAPSISSDKALQIARQDAENVYPELQRFRIAMALEPDGWHIEYHVNRPGINGGGPHYVIDAATGAILSKKYYQ